MYKNKALDAIVGQAYRDKIMHNQSSDAALSVFKAKAMDDPALRAAAVKELAAAKKFTSSARNGSCVVTQFAAEFLQQAVDSVPGLAKEVPTLPEGPQKKTKLTPEEVEKLIMALPQTKK